MQMVMTPCEIEVMLHCYYSLVPHPRLRYPAINEALNNLWNLNLIKPTKENVFGATEKGKAWVAMICATPIPVLEWLDPRTGRAP